MRLTLLRRAGAVGVVAALVTGLRAEASEYSPRVLSPHNADTYSMKTFARFPRWRELEGDARAWEVFRYLADSRTGLFPLGMEVLEGRDVLSEYQTVRDPVKLINVYGYGYCGILGPVMAGVCQEMGLGPSRTLILPGWHHVAAETLYEGNWHYLDLDVRAAFRRPDGSLASLADARRDASLWKGPQGPLFFPLDPLDEVQAIYRKTPVQHYYGYYSSGHTMDFILRRGETFTRWWQPQGGRWNHLAAYHKDPFFKNLFEQLPRGPKSKHDGWTIHSHSNGRFVYRPNLTAVSDFADGAYDAENLRPATGGLTLVKPGQGFAIFEVRSPYVIVPRVGRMETTDDDCEASVVQLDASGAKLDLSLDNGLTWQDLGDGRESLDLTPHVSGTYGYLLKILLKGEPGKAVVRSLSITTWVQVAPASLPSLRKGKNRMEFQIGDHYGLPSHVVEIRANGSDRAGFLKYIPEAPHDYDPARNMARVRGSFIVRVPAPPGSKITWFSAGGSFNTHQQAAAKNTRNAIDYSVDEPGQFRAIYQAKIPSDQDHWHYNADCEVRLDRPARVLYLRYLGDPGVNNLRIYAHCVDDRPRTGSPVTITHAWRENDVLRTKTVTLRTPGPYEITTAAEPVDAYMELSIPRQGD